MNENLEKVFTFKMTKQLYSELAKEAEKMDISMNALIMQVLYSYVDNQGQKEIKKLSPKDYKDLERLNGNIAKCLIEYSFLISQKVNNVDFEKEELWKIQNAFRGFNHGASAYKKIYQILQEAEPDNFEK